MPASAVPGDVITTMLNLTEMQQWLKHKLEPQLSQLHVLFIAKQVKAVEHLCKYIGAQQWHSIDGRRATSEERISGKPAASKQMVGCT